MKLVSTIHRWAGGFIGLLLAVIGLTGAILVWEGAWVTLPGAADPVVENPARIAAIVGREQARSPVSRVTFASEEIGLHQIVYRDGGGAYARQDGTIVDRWASDWGRPELWLFDLHHHLFAGEAGETVTGIAGLAGIVFVVTGVVLWLRSRARFRPRLLPRSLQPGPIVSHHRDLGLVAAPLLLLSFTTGVLMVFPSIDRPLLGPPETAAKAVADGPTSAGPVPIGAILRQAKTRFPDARLRRVTFPAADGGAVTVRMRQPFEWTPNGRTQLSFDPGSGRLLQAQDPAAGGTGGWIREKFYPVHTAKVGGPAMKLLMSLSGLSLALLGGLATYSFWWRRRPRRARRHVPLPSRETATLRAS